MRHSAVMKLSNADPLLSFQTYCIIISLAILFEPIGTLLPFARFRIHVYNIINRKHSELGMSCMY